ncbi:S1C family serine protease [Streptomyces griseorubiginosus]|uniref:S1C family serine protease n=1 Tax=Streptomyces griseorubiginosus TaxID=67304 RepID=UPI002E81BECD|nr:trypsin-like peptidase domain-containing protein [Streptomyces griseorubiginosus]WUB44504.1 trypsin-like peptidase domain-containing protein [Streptomyces griseorubiginosus]WUB53022.1 trypsin-like peptidase domain-containing protein [Streptomyces griseorubiginosus]
MDEGKPTRSTWWSRPRSREGFGPGEPEVLGDTPGPGTAAVSSDGDFALQAPGDATGSASGGPASEGDFELAPPKGAAEDSIVRTPGSGTSERDTEGDYELAAPRGDAGAGQAPGLEETDGKVRQLPVEPAVDRPEPTPVSDSTGTPPYGVPGPWAPAPPVQHPATSSAETREPVPPEPQDTAILPPPEPHHTTGQSASGAPGTPVAGPPSPTAPGAYVAPPPAPSPASAGDTTSALPDAPTPWQNYDPWAPAPLQQTGAALRTKDQRSRRSRQALLAGALLLALVAGGAGGVVGAYLERHGVGDDVVELPQAGRESGERAPGTVAGIAARALPSVVTLHVSGAAESGTGTGFVLDDAGHILTNNHVVEPAGADGEISVTFHSGDTAKATLVGRDSGYDLAVVEVSGVHGLRPMALGNSDNVQVGDPVVAIGAPFDLEGTVTSGIISAKERPITAGGERGDGSDVSYVDALQTDAPINPGNSGGPLLDSRARVIGINSAIRSAGNGSGSDSAQAGSIGLGFAIPVNQAKRVAEELINTGTATHPVIGVTLDMDYTGDGARVGTKGNGGGPAVREGGPGDRAGLKAGDVITAVDGRRVHSGDELIVRTRAHRPGDRLRLTLERAGKEVTVTLTLGSSDGS